MRRIYLFLYYCYALQWPVYDTYIFSFALAWELATIADEDKKIDERWHKSHTP